MRILTLFACALLITVACKSKQKGTETTVKNETPAPAVTLSAELSAASDIRYPGLPKEDIAAGEKLYNGECGRCHRLFEPEFKSEQDWPAIMDWMAPKAQLSDAQKQKVLKYVLCAADVNKKGK
ncbi:MAG: hypothetical protein K0S33_3978 [Bacteroidetes bacterium]|nr:hypothetical protein [Bacteroidota bacterium]